MKITVILLFFLSSFISVLHAQDLPRIVPPSPNATMLARFGEVPVNMYNGIPSISIPLGEVNNKSFTLPISLDYHAGGVRMSDESGTVGLNWTLKAGGAISRTIRGNDDFQGYASSTLSFPELTVVAQDRVILMGQTTSGWTNEIMEESGTNTVTLGNIMDQPTAYEFLADKFTYNILGKAGKFIFKRSGEFVMEQEDDIKLKFNSNAFEILDEDGNEYLFEEQERTEAGTFSQLLTTTWHISKITNPLGDEINFHYSDYNASATPQFNDMYFAGAESCGSNDVSQTSHANFHYMKILDSITYDYGVVHFIYDNERLDYSSGIGKKLVRIEFREGSNRKLIKAFKLGYGYFMENGDHTQKRLRLDYVQQVSESEELPIHQFKYESAQAGGAVTKNTRSIDHWGYFNGKGNTVLYKGYTGDILKSSIYGVILGSNFHRIPGANRDVDSTYAKAFMLKEILYPTGGKTVFEFESNEFDSDSSNNNNLSGFEYDLVTKTYYATIDNTGTTTGSFDLSNLHGGVVDVNITFICQSSSGCNFSSVGEQLYVDFMGQHVLAANQSCSGIACTKTFSLTNQPAQNYPYTVYVGSQITNLSLVRIAVTVEELKTDNFYNNKNYFVGGGLRIRTLTNYGSNNEVISKKRYQYRYKQDRNNDGIEETYSYGKRMSPPRYHRYQIIESPTGSSSAPCAAFAIYGSSVTSLTNSAQGAAVGYSKVIVYDEDQNGNKNGKTEYVYLNNIDEVKTYFYPGHDFGERVLTGGFSVRKPGLNNESDPNNGNLLEEKVYKGLQSAGSYELLKETKYFYRTISNEKFYNLDYEKINWISDFNFTPRHYYVTYYHPVLNNSITYKDSVVYKEFSDGQTFQKTTRYYYDSEYHYQMTSMDEDIDETTKKVIKYYYPTETISNLSFNANTAKDSLVAQHRLATVLQNEEFINVNGSLNLINQTRNNYIYNVTGTPQVDNIQIGLDGNPLENRIFFEKYDSDGNILDVSKSDNHKIGYTWGYDNRLPIAEVLNATNSNIFYTSFEEGGVQGNAATGDFYHNSGTFTIPSSSIPTGTNLMVSYWYYDGSWKYNPPVPYTSSTISKAGASRIDEVRVYPSAAQIRTYTYNEGFGPSTITDNNGVRTFYQYDEFGRLTKILDDELSVVEQFKYNYATIVEADNTSFNFSHLGGIDEINISSNTSWHIDLPTSPFYSVSPLVGVGDEKIQVSVTNNQTSTVRNSSFDIVSDDGQVIKTITLSQTATQLTLTPTQLNINSSGSPVTFQVSSNSSWTITENVIWMSSSNITPSSGTNNQTVTVDVAANTSTSPRSAIITVRTSPLLSKTISVTQAGASNYLTVTPTSLNITQPSVSSTVSVSASSTWSHTVNYVNGGSGWLNVTRSGNQLFVSVPYAPSGSGPFDAVVVVTGGGITRNVYVSYSGGSIGF